MLRAMLAKLSLPITLLLFTACKGNTYHVDAGAMFARARGEVALQNAAGTLDLGSNQNSLGALDVDGREAAPFLRLETRHDKHRFQLNGFDLESDGNGTLTGDFGDIPSGSSVSAALDFLAINGVYTYEVLRKKNLRLAVGAEVAFYQLDLGVIAGASRESVTTDTIVPMPHVEAETFFGDFSALGSIAAMGADLGDGSGRYFDTSLTVRWKVLPEFDVFGGYRFLLVDAYGSASGRDFDSDVEVQGWFIGGGIRF